MNENSKTNWARVDALEDDALDTSDSPLLSDDFFDRAQWRKPTLALQVVVAVDPDTLAWFQEQGTEANGQMTAALRIYAEAHKSATMRHKTV